MRARARTATRMRTHSDANAHAQRRECARSRVPGDAVPFRRTCINDISGNCRTCMEGGTARHRQAPSCVRIRVAVRARARAPPPAAARGPGEGYLTRANPFAAVPGAYPSQSGAPGFAFSRFSAASPGHAFAPLSATGLVPGQVGKSPEIYVIL